MDRQIYKKFLSLVSALSPENLHCDGEISPAEAKTKYHRLMKQWRQLESQVGRSVSEEEIWGLYEEDRHEAVQSAK